MFSTNDCSARDQVEGCLKCKQELSKVASIAEVFSELIGSTKGCSVREVRWLKVRAPIKIDTITKEKTRARVIFNQKMI